jgi:hypothetical protein
LLLAYVGEATHSFGLLLALNCLLLLDIVGTFGISSETPNVPTDRLRRKSDNKTMAGVLTENFIRADVSDEIR